MGFKSFEEIQAWKDARSLTKIIRNICKQDPTRLDFAWVDQITRACISIMANIAEGFEAQSDVEFATFLGYAKRSASEVRSLLYYGKDQSYLTEEEFTSTLNIGRKISASLNSLIKYLRKSQRKVRISPTSK